MKLVLFFGILNMLIEYNKTNIKDEQKCINKIKKNCSVKFGFSQKAH